VFPPSGATVSAGTRRAGRTALWVVALVAVGVGAVIAFASQWRGIESKFPPIPSMDAVNVVRDGVLEQYNTTTVGKAFEATFQNVNWQSFETPKGETVVEFSGTYSGSRIDAFGCATPCRKQLDKVRSDCLASTDLGEKAASLEREIAEHLRVYNAFRADWSVRNGLLLSQVSDDPESYRKREALTAENDSATRKRMEETSLEQRQLQELMGLTEECVESRTPTTDIPVKFQFTLTADKKSFAVTFFDVWSLNEVLYNIYH